MCLTDPLHPTAGSYGIHCPSASEAGGEEVPLEDLREHGFCLMKGAPNKVMGSPQIFKRECAHST